MTGEEWLRYRAEKREATRTAWDCLPGELFGTDGFIEIEERHDFLDFSDPKVMDNYDISTELRLIDDYAKGE